MRIIAGKYASRKLETLKGQNTRPTLDKVKEAVFSSLGGFFDGGMVLDLYGGSGAIAFEALSRGMDHACIVDKSRAAIEIIRKNAKGYITPQGKGFYEIEHGEYTVLRFDGLKGQYYLFAGTGHGVEGPLTNGNYLWLETDNWPKWEKKFIFGPYIHHVVGIPGDHVAVIREACRYLGLHFDSPDDPNFVYDLT